MTPKGRRVKPAPVSISDVDDKQIACGRIASENNGVIFEPGHHFRSRTP